MTTVAKLNYLRKQAGLPLIRFDITRLRAEDIQELRDAYAALYEISDTAIGDKRGYTAVARGHGYDLDLCHTDSRLFLTWHRSYIYTFEKNLNSALQWKTSDSELELTLPFWDWTSFKTDTHASNGIPKTVNDPTYQDAAGDTVENPLARARSLFRVVSQSLTGEQQFTQRFPRDLRSTIPLLKDEVERYLDNPSYMSFQSDLDGGAHGSVHVVTGGTSNDSPLPNRNGDMQRVISAAFDPIFWMHHSMCDKVWFDWQALHPGTSIPQHVMDSVVYDGRIGHDLIDAEASLRYIYSPDSVESALTSVATVPQAMAMAAAPPTTVTDDTGPVEVALGTVEAGFARVQLDFHRLRPPKESFEIRAYMDKSKAKAKTGFKDDSYAGRLVLFGHGECHGAAGHCNPDLAKRDEYDKRAKHPLRYEHTAYCLDITRGLRHHFGRKHSLDDVKVYLVTLDGDGKEVAPTEVKYEGVSLRRFA